jgi:hypothetical protein
MSTNPVYSFLSQQFQQHLDPTVPQSSRERLALLVCGILQAKSAAPAQIARALGLLGLVQAMTESIERRIRRIENDGQITAALCLHPLARHYLALGKPKQLLLVLDPTCQEDRVVMVTVAVWYRGRALPLCWMLWPGNQKLTGARFWERIAQLLEQVAPLLPRGVPVIWLADRAFGTPQFSDLLAQFGWHFVVRVQEQTRCRAPYLSEQAVGRLLAKRGQRCKLRGELFKKSGWRRLSLVCLWGRRHKKPLSVVSDLPVGWNLLALYRRRYPIEGLFRDYKSSGWHWEQGQVTDLSHLERLLVGMALSTWAAVMAGAHVAEQALAAPATGRRRTRCFLGKYSLFQLGLDYLHRLLLQPPGFYVPRGLPDWDAPNWQTQCHAHHVRAFILGRQQTPSKGKIAPVRP